MSPQVKQFTLDQLTMELQVAAFLGAYKFWNTIRHEQQDRSRGDGLLKVLAGLAAADLHKLDRPLLPQEEEAFGNIKGWEPPSKP
jgi:hypothetical protein